MSGARSRDGSSRRLRAGGLAALLLCTTVTATAGADSPSIWTRARRPDVDQRADLVAEAESLQLRAVGLHSRRARRDFDPQELASLSEMYLTRAALLLEEAGARTSSDLFARFQLAEVYGLLARPAKSAALLESIVRGGAPPVLRARAHAQLAIEYAHVGRIDDEITQYGEALRLQPIPHERSRLLANRAEAYMLLGDVTAAVGGYRDALALLSTDHMLFGSGPTTLWGLAVALDRSGDLDGGLESVRLARSYDPRDEQINGEGWFFLPDHDRYWYGALGHWMVARKTDMGSVRADAYTHAVTDWEAYVSHAAREDPWVAVARVRLAQCKKEQAEFLRREKIRRTEDAHRRGKKPEAPSRPLTPDDLMKGWTPDP